MCRIFYDFEPKIPQVIPCITMLARSLERTGGPEEEGVRLFKDELKETVLKKDANRFGDIITNDFYLVSTLCDPRYTSKSYLCGLNCVY